MITVYDHPLSPYGQKVKIALLEKGIEFAATQPDAIGSGTTGGTFADISPRGKVPVLVDAGFAVFDSTVILEYIEDCWPEPALLPGNPADRARVRMLERANGRNSVAACLKAAQAVGFDSGAVSLETVRGALEQGLFKCGYRDHRLEWMIKSGGLTVVEAGLARGNIRFIEPFR